MWTIEKLFWHSLFLQLCTSSTHGSVLIRVNIQPSVWTFFQWHRMPTTQETDGFQVKRPGDVNVKCTLLFMLDHQVPQRALWPLPSAGWLACVFRQCCFDWLVTICSSRHSTNWTPVWPVCWVCTHRHVPVSCRLSGFTLKTTSYKTVTRRSTSTATVTFDRLAIHRLLLLIIVMSAGCTSIIGLFNEWTVLFFHDYVEKQT